MTNSLYRFSIGLLLACLSSLPFQGTSLSEDEGPLYLDAGRGKKPFDISKRSVPRKAIREGGPPRDAIPALDSPTFVKAQEASSFLKGKERVIGVIEKGLAKAYPIKILVWHEVVNDEIRGRPITVAY